MIKYDCIIIGGGAAGVFAAVTLKRARPDMNIAIIEKSRPLHKLTLTGKGRCNITTAKEPVGGIVRNPKFLMSAFNAFPNIGGNGGNTVDFFTEIGVPTVVERGERVFPVSQKATDVAKALLRQIEILKIDLISKNVTSLLTENKSENTAEHLPQIRGVVCNGNNIIKSNNVILATGGASYPATGSDVGGYKLAADAGHTVTPPLPSLVPLVTRENVAELEGLTLKNVRLVFDKAYARRIGRNCPNANCGIGEVIFTDDGIGGALAVTASAFITECFPADIDIRLDFKPGLDVDKLRGRVLRDLDGIKAREGSRGVAEALMRGLLPSEIVPYFLRRCGIDTAKPRGGFATAEIDTIVTQLKGMHFTVVGTKPLCEAVCTRGGVAVNEINPKTMQSKLVGGLYFAGEVIDTDGLTGGYNLQIAWSTAFAAAGGVV